MVNGKYFITGEDRCGLIGSMYTHLKDKNAALPVAHITRVVYLFFLQWVSSIKVT